MNQSSATVRPNGFRYVAVSRPDRVSPMYVPTFLILGPQRTGTTWLSQNLRHHPEVKFSRPKELFFFNTLPYPQHPKYQSTDLDWYLRFFRDSLRQRCGRNLFCLRQYGEFYRPVARGEATASYALLTPELIQEVVTLNPNIRAIMIVRDPIQRAWSSAKRALVRNRKRRFEDVPFSEFQALYCDSYEVQCPLYERHYRRWSSALKDGHVFVARFEEILNDPRRLLLDVMSFLGVRSQVKYLNDDFETPVNPTDTASIPPQHQLFLEELLKGEIERYRDFEAWVRKERTGESKHQAAAEQAHAQ